MTYGRPSPLCGCSMQAPMMHSKWPRYTPSDLSIKKLVSLQEYIEMRLKD